ncbi:amino acid permease [Klebsiella pneumoniae]|uniref:amino acid permease n=1 Tax=Klebsiella pneumoniae TaxID=573 RepID=UPI001EED7FD0|nr:amino acid permease [Klebsiella pneumoniae]
MKYTLPALTLAISAALSGCATPHSSAVSQPVVDSPVPNVAQPLQRQLAEGLYEMALSPQGDALYVASAEGFKNVQGGAVYTLDPHTLNTIGLTHTDLKNFALQLSAEGKTLYVSNSLDGGITAAEAQNPEKSIPKAVNQVVYRILLFYIGSLVVLLALYPWVEIKSDSSPFVMIFHNLDSNLVASALNFVILVASLSVYNSGVYSNSRMLFGLSVQGNAPKFLARVSKRGVPVNSLLLSGIITSLVVVLNYLLPHEALGLLMALVVATLLLNWIMICMAHLKFRAAQRRKGRESKFKALLAPASNYFCIAFLGLILALMCTIDGMRLSAILLPVWILFLFIAFKLLRRPA